jgi:hypothetical protein
LKGKHKRKRTRERSGTDIRKSRKGNGRKGLFVAVGIGGAVLLAAVAVLVVILVNGQKPTTEIVPGENGTRGTVLTEAELDQVIAARGEPVPDGQYRVHMNTDWVFPSGSEPCEDAMVANHDTNTRTVYFDLTIAETGELVYSSPYIPVGNALEGFALDTPLPAGEYDAVVTYHLVDDANAEVTTLNVGVKLTVEA